MHRTVAIVIFATACTGNLEPPASGASLCDSDADCVGGQICGEFGRCVEPGTDTSALQFTGTVSLTPALVRANQALELRFSLNRPAIFDPVVTLQGVGETLTLSLTEFNESTNEYRYSYTASGSEAEAEFRGQVRISDVFDTEIEALSESTVLFDFTAPLAVSDTAVERLSPSSANPLTTGESATQG
ncbi:MAG: hypothetical protein AAFY60_19150, partial [Myxococcota bacterium]